MKTKLTIKELREGNKRLNNVEECIGALTLKKALKENGTGSKIVTWGASSGYFISMAGRIIKVKTKQNLYNYGSTYYIPMYIRLLIKPKTITFTEV